MFQLGSPNILFKNTDKQRLVSNRLHLTKCIHSSHSPHFILTILQTNKRLHNLEFHLEQTEP